MEERKKNLIVKKSKMKYFREKCFMAVFVVILLFLLITFYGKSVKKITLENGSSSENLTFVWKGNPLKFQEDFQIHRRSSLASLEVTCSTNHPEVAEISSDGLITIHDKGDAVVTIKSKSSPWVKAKIRIHVVTSVIRMPKEIPKTEVYYLLHKDDPLQFQYESSLKDKFTFESEDESVVKVDDSGNVTVTGVGLATITATYRVKGIEYTKNFNVKICPISDHTSLAEHTLRWYDESVLVAHALGGIAGYKYTNSKEAFINSVKAGYKVMEVDFNKTRDGVLVCRHSWTDQTYDVSYDGRVPSYKEFKSEKLYGRLTTLSAEDLLELWSKYPDIYLIADFKFDSSSGSDELLEEIQTFVDTAKKCGCEQLLSKLIIQLYHPTWYKYVKKIWPFENYLITFYQIDEYSSEPKMAASLSQKEKMGVLVMGKGFVDLRKFGSEFLNLADQYEQNIFIHTVDYKSPKIWSSLKKGVDGFYTDFTTPDSLKQAFDMD